MSTGRDGKGIFPRRYGTAKCNGRDFLDGTGRHKLTFGEIVGGTGRDHHGSILTAVLPPRLVQKISPVALCRPVPSRKYPLTVPSRRQKLPLPSRPVLEAYPYLPVPSSNLARTVPSRRQNLSLPSNPSGKTCPDRRSPQFIAVTPSHQDAVAVNMP